MKKILMKQINFVNTINLKGKKGNYEMLSIKFQGELVDDKKKGQEKTFSTLIFPSDLTYFINCSFKGEIELTDKTTFSVNKFKTKDGQEKEEIQIKFLIPQFKDNGTADALADDSILWD